MKNHILQTERKLNTTKEQLLRDSVKQNDIDFSHDFLLPYSKAERTSEIKLVFIGQDPTVRRVESYKTYLTTYLQYLKRNEK